MVTEFEPGGLNWEPMLWTILYHCIFLKNTNTKRPDLQLMALVGKKKRSQISRFTVNYKKEYIYAWTQMT